MSSSYARSNEREFLRYVHNLRGHFVEGHDRLYRANQQSLAWLTDRAARNLEASATRRQPDTRNSPRLARVIRDPSVSMAFSDGFRFLIDEKVKAAHARAWAYYRVIEGGPGSDYGRNYWVRRTAGNLVPFSDRRFGLVFFGPGGFGRQQGRGSWNNPKFPQVRITTPQPAYHYVENAVNDFITEDIGRKNIVRELRDSGVPVNYP